MSEKKVFTKTTNPFRLNPNKGLVKQVCDMEKVFGFIPEKIILEQIGKHTFVITAIVPDALVNDVINLEATKIKKN